MRKKGFTLIELIAVLVILAILALIVTPLVMNIIRKAKTSADKRSIDAYGRSVELAIANYLLDNGDFPTDVSQLTIEYSGDRVECSTTQLNSDSTIYLAGCTVGGRNVDYAYGNNSSSSYKSYSIGDQVTYNNVNYYVIKDSNESEEAVTLLKAEPLTVDEVNQYGGVGTEYNHVNVYATSSTTADYYQKAYNNNGYGGMQYFSSDNCHFNFEKPWASPIMDGCIVEYSQSEIKYVVDAWAKDKIESEYFIDSRLINYDDMINLGYENSNRGTIYPATDGSTPSWFYNCNYWTMSLVDEFDGNVWISLNNGNFVHEFIANYSSTVRPVITINKNALSN